MGGNAVSTQSDLALRSQQKELEKCEVTITEHGQAFVEVGRALARIRDAKLYRGAGFKTFEKYCRQRWEMTPQHAGRLIGASTLVSELEPIGSIPTNEAQIRPLLKLPNDDRAKVWEMAVETAPDGKVTAKHVARLVDERLGNPTPSRPSKPTDSERRREAPRDGQQTTDFDGTLIKMMRAVTEFARMCGPNERQDLANELRNRAAEIEEMG